MGVSELVVTVFRSRGARLSTAGALVVLLALCAFSADSSGERVRYDISGLAITSGNYTLYTMFLDEGQEVTVSLSVTGGPADFYFLDGGGLSDFLAARADGSSSGWDYYEPLSALNATSIDETDSVSSAGVYHVAILNDGAGTVVLSGFIEAVYPTSLLSIAIIAGVIIVAVVLVLIFMFSRQTRKMQHSVDTHELHRTPPVPQRTSHEHPGSGHEAHLDRSTAKCPSCGAALVPGARFCKSCGRSVGR